MSMPYMADENKSLTEESINGLYKKLLEGLDYKTLVISNREVREYTIPQNTGFDVLFYVYVSSAGNVIAMVKFEEFKTKVEGKIESCIGSKFIWRDKKFSWLSGFSQDAVNMRKRYSEYNSNIFLIDMKQKTSKAVDSVSNFISSERYQMFTFFLFRKLRIND